MNLEQVRAHLEAELPPVTLLLGPDQDALWNLAWHMRRHWGVSAAGDSMTIRKLTAVDARSCVVFSGRAPLNSRFRLAVISMDGATEQAQNILLKVLEEPPLTSRFILLASYVPLPTILSRAQVLRVGVLTGEEALTEPGEKNQRARSAVAAALKAADSQDEALLAAALRGWEPWYTVQLGAWAIEASSGRWRLFDASFAPGATMEHARKVLVLLNLYAGSRNSAAVALDQAFREKQ